MTTLGTIAKTSVGWSIAISILMIVAGILAIVIPPVAGITAILVVAWLLIFSGAAHLIFAWHTRTAGAAVWEVLLAILYGAVGVYALLHPVAGLAALTLLLGSYLFAEGALEIILFFRMRSMQGSSWLILDGIVTLVLAALIWMTWPSNTEWVIGTLIGISMLFSGVSRLALSMAARRVVTEFPLSKAA